MNEKEIKLNLGCGKNVLDGWVNVDINPADNKVNKLDLNKLANNFKSATVDTIKLENTLQYLTYEEGMVLLKECYLILKPGGQIYIEVPSLRNVCANLLESNMNKSHWLAQIYGTQENVWDFAKSGYDYEMLEVQLQTAGFTNLAKQDLPREKDYMIGLLCTK